MATYDRTVNNSVIVLSYENMQETLESLDIDGAILEDDTVGTTDYVTEANNDTTNDFKLLPDAPATNDGFWFGFDSIEAVFIRLVLNIGTAGAGTWTITYRYNNASGETNLLDANVVFKSAQFLNFRTAGRGSMIIVPPADWIQTAVGGITKYWLFAKVTSFTSMTTQPLGTQIWQSLYNEASGIALPIISSGVIHDAMQRIIRG